MAKITETSVPVERTFSIEVTQSELGAIFCAVGITCGADIATEAVRAGVPYVGNLSPLYEELKQALRLRRY